MYIYIYIYLYIYIPIYIYYVCIHVSKYFNIFQSMTQWQSSPKWGVPRVSELPRCKLSALPAGANGKNCEDVLSGCWFISSLLIGYHKTGKSGKNWENVYIHKKNVIKYTINYHYIMVRLALNFGLLWFVFVAASTIRCVFGCPTIWQTAARFGMRAYRARPYDWPPDFMCVEKHGEQPLFLRSIRSIMYYATYIKLKWCIRIYIYI